MPLRNNACINWHHRRPGAGCTVESSKRTSRGCCWWASMQAWFKAFGAGFPGLQHGRTALVPVPEELRITAARPRTCTTGVVGVEGDGNGPGPGR